MKIEIRDAVKRSFKNLRYLGFSLISKSKIEEFVKESQVVRLCRRTRDRLVLQI